MKLTYLLIGMVIATLGCSNPPPANEDMPARPADMAPACEQTKTTGEACNTRKACECIADSEKDSACIKEIDLTSIDPSLLIELPENYCSTKTCTIGKSCGDGGICIDLLGATGPTCMRRCRTKGSCRAGYKCFEFDVDPNDAMSTAVTNVCFPPDGFADCDPTADPKTQCTMLGTTSVASVTNGNPNAGCIRRGIDDIGLCRFLPCSIGPKNCPNANASTPQSCVFIDLGRQFPGGMAGDKGVGTFCVNIPAPAMAKKLNEACQFLNSCDDNLICQTGTCRQTCYNGTQPTFAGGNPMYKNAAAACPMGTVCKDVYMIGGANWPGVCVPP